MIDVIKMACGETNSLHDSFSLLQKLLDYFGIREDLKLKKVEENICKIQNLLKLINKKGGKYKSTSDFLRAKNVAIQDWLSSDIEFSFFLSKAGAKKKSILDVGRSSKYQKLSDMEKLHSPASNIAFSLSILENNPAVKNLSFSDSFKLSNIECLGLLSYLQISVNKYKNLRKFLLKNNINILQRYQDLLEFRKTFIPSSLSITENTAEMPLFDVLENTLFSILDFNSLDSSEEIKVFAKYGGDGMTDGSDYKIHKEFSDTCDNSTFIVCIFVLRIEQGDKILFNNQSYAYPFYCRPVRIFFKKESRDFIKVSFESLNEEIRTINSFQCLSLERCFDSPLFSTQA